LMTGSTLPRLQTRDIEKLSIPVPCPGQQNAICKEAQKRELQAKRLREEAQRELEKAKAEIEAILLGDAT